MEEKKDKRFFTKKKVCKFCSEPIKIDYKDYDLLSSFITERRKIVPRRSSGLCARHQRVLASAIKRARIMALLPFTVLH
jgi:small subunit ribosomal protein S18